MILLFNSNQWSTRFGWAHTHGYRRYVVICESVCLLRHSIHITQLDMNSIGKIDHHHLEYKYKNAYGALCHLLWLGTERRHATIMFFFISTVRTILMRTSFWRTNYFYLSCVTLSNSPILAQPKQINCFSSSWTLSKNELTFPSSFPVSSSVLCQKFLLMLSIVLRISVQISVCSLDGIYKFKWPARKDKVLSCKIIHQNS